MKELGHIHRLFAALNELLANGQGSPVVNTIGSSVWEFFLTLDSVTVSATVFAIERIVALFKNSLEIKSLQKSLAEKQFSPDIVAMMNTEIENQVRKGIASIARDIRQKFAQNPDEARSNELETQLRQELIHMAEFINRGAAYEVRAGLPNRPKDLTAEEQQNPELAASFTIALSEFEAKRLDANSINEQGSAVSRLNGTPSEQMPLLLNYGEQDVDNGAA